MSSCQITLSVEESPSVALGVESDQTYQMQVSDTPEVGLSVEDSPSVALGVEGEPVYQMQVSEAIVASGDSPEYDGSYNVTPTQAEQVLPTSNRHLSQDIHVAPIPTNYGLITYNGAVITVS